MPVLHPAELWKRTGRYGIPELFKLKDRVGRDLVLSLTHEEIIAVHAAEAIRSYRDTAADLVPHPDQGAGRAAPAGRRPAHARIHHEGLVHDRPRPGRARSRLRPARGRVRPHLPPLRHHVLQGRLRRRHDGRLRRARVHGAVAGGRGSGRAVRRLRLRLQRRDGGVRAAAGDPAAGRAARGGAHAGRRHHRGAGRVPRHRRGPDREVRDRRAGGRAGRGGAGRRAGRPPRCTSSSSARRSARRTARRSRTRSARRSAPTRARSAPSASPTARCARS